MLKSADDHRRGDLDGRGNLTEAGLIGWIHNTLDTCIDQVRFMREGVATDLVSSLLKNSYLASDSTYGALRFAIPRSALGFYFLELWPEAEAV